MKRQIPNLITCLNVTSGTLAIFMVVYGDLFMAALLVLLAMIFDFFDGFVARLLHVKSELGKELDSLADVVSFGVVPALLAHMLIRGTLGEGADYSLCAYFCLYIPVIIPAFSAYRLAKFNLDTRQSYSFIGMPTPANALFWVSLVLTAHFLPDFYASIWGFQWLLVCCVVLFSILLVVELPMFSLKVTDFSWRTNWNRYLYFVVLLLLVLLLQLRVISFVIPLYLLFSLLGMMGAKCRREVG